MKFTFPIKLSDICIPYLLLQIFRRAAWVGIVLATVFTNYIFPFESLKHDNQLILKGLAIAIGCVADIHFHHALHTDSHFFWNSTLLLIILVLIWVPLQFKITEELQLQLIIGELILLAVYNFAYLTDQEKLYKSKTIELKEL